MIKNRIGFIVVPKGNNHIFVVNDHFSKYVNLCLVKNDSAKFEAKYLERHMPQFDILTELLSDMDASFENQLF